MKKGMLITNGFVGEESFKSLFRALMEAAEKESIAIAVSYTHLTLPTT